MWAMTPGGSKLQWSRSQLLHYANSPLSKSPLHLPRIPGVTVADDTPKESDEISSEEGSDEVVPKMATPSKKDEDPLFNMDE